MSINCCQPVEPPEQQPEPTPKQPIPVVEERKLEPVLEKAQLPQWQETVVKFVLHFIVELSKKQGGRKIMDLHQLSLQTLQTLIEVGIITLVPVVIKWVFTKISLDNLVKYKALAQKLLLNNQQNSPIKRNSLLSFVP